MLDNECVEQPLQLSAPSSALLWCQPGSKRVQRALHVNVYCAPVLVVARRPCQVLLVVVTMKPADVAAASATAAACAAAAASAVAAAPAADAGTASRCRGGRRRWRTRWRGGAVCHCLLWHEQARPQMRT